MKCPYCVVDLLEVDRLDIEVDYCPTCRGVWLDRGELDKLISRAAGAAPAPGSPHYDDSGVDYPVQPRSKSGFHEKPPRKKRSSFLRELFDFG
jgi:Zn-finger nucleic acid-binding protein